MPNLSFQTEVGLCVFILSFSFRNIFTSGFEQCIALDSCSCRQVESGKVISLQELERNSATTPVFSGIQDAGLEFLYYYNPCTPFKYSGLAAEALAFQTDTLGQNIKDIADPELTVSFDDLLNQYIFTYVGSNPDGERNFKVTLNCDTTADNPSISQVTEGPSGTYSALLSSKCCCPGMCKYDPKHSGKHNKKEGLSTGSILCIVLLVFVLVYISAGIAINYFIRKKEGSEIFPNTSFWKELPSYIKDGCLFSYKKVRRRDEGYEAIR